MKNAPSNFLKNIRPKGVVSLGCKFDDWLFRFFWYILRKDINHIDSTLKDAVAVSFSSEYIGKRYAGFCWKCNFVMAAFTVLAMDETKS